MQEQRCELHRLHIILAIASPLPLGTDHSSPIVKLFCRRRLLCTRLQPLKHPHCLRIQLNARYPHDATWVIIIEQLERRQAQKTMSSTSSLPLSCSPLIPFLVVVHVFDN